MLDVGLALTALGFGFRHGFDWDHIAAITDITSSEQRGRRAVLLATLYALGHGLVVLALGVLAVVTGDTVPDSVDRAMGRVVGLTLVVLGLWVFWSLARHGRDFRMRSRWMLVLAGARRGWRRVRGTELVAVEHDHEHDHGDHQHEHERVLAAASTAGLMAAVPASRHRHPHRHVGTLPDDPFASYTTPTAFGVGMLHGIGAETPTQLVLFATAAGAAGRGEGMLVVVAFIVGLLAANTTVAVASAFGFLRAGANWWLYAGVAAVTAACSLALGVLYLLGQDGVLPALFG